MTAPDQETLSYRTVAGDDVETLATVLGDDGPAPPWLVARSVELADGTRARQLFVDQAPGAKELPDEGCQRLDNEILAGLRLSRQVRSRAYPAEVSRLIGYTPDSAVPFALLEPYWDESADEVAGHLVQESQIRFRISLLTGIRWLAAAGISHGGICPSTVCWDGDRAQITDFSHATLIGTARRGGAAEARTVARGLSGPASEGDDVLAAGLLIYYVVTGEDLAGPDKLDDWPALRTLLDGVFLENPEHRPTAAKLLERLEVPDPVPPQVPDPLAEGRADFESRRREKRPCPGSTQPNEVAGPLARDDENDWAQPRRRRRWLGGR